MAKLQSRNEIFKSEIEKKNKFISENSGIFNFDTYVNSSLDELIKIDKEYYTSLKTKLSTEYENIKFYLDHDIMSDFNNYELIESIDEVLSDLKDLETRDISLFDGEQLGAHFNERNFYSAELKDMFYKLTEINNKYITDYKNSKVLQTNYAGFNNKTLAKNLLLPEQEKAISDKILAIKNKSEIIQKIQSEQNGAMHELERNKKKFKYKIKKFFIAFALFAFIGIVGILISILA
ncbi:hypothetical protein EELLY_v1c06770 [Entomoplasma ellychniae]|uniref:Uncharacterized protein n=1 Tax=Entomoplasma ellychniae TaxID=2114 RepID=A0A8E2QWJ5_9MOLU|nr:hypothetical protein [Entomoplasma ellychniae]PPE04991.1 hypothetical protein EELLY_v1c06770 [Entomoplasma ellychniae]